jgi:hypothetical protein
MQRLLRRQQEHRHFYFGPRPGYYSTGPTQRDYENCIAVEEETGGCYIDDAGNIHYVAPGAFAPAPRIYERDRGAEMRDALIGIFGATLDAVRREQELKRQELLLKQQEANPPAAAAPEAAPPEPAPEPAPAPPPEPTVDSVDMGAAAATGAENAKKIAPLPAPAPR